MMHLALLRADSAVLLVSCAQEDRHPRLSVLLCRISDRLGTKCSQSPASPGAGVGSHSGRIRRGCTQPFDLDNQKILERHKHLSNAYTQKRGNPRKRPLSLPQASAPRPHIQPLVQLPPSFSSGQPLCLLDANPPHFKIAINKIKITINTTIATICLLSPAVRATFPSAPRARSNRL